MKLLKSSQLAKIKKPGMHRVADGLYLRVAPGGSKQFVQRIVIQGKRRDIGLGGWPATSLAKAKYKAACNRVKAIDGASPFARRCAVCMGRESKASVPLFADIQHLTLEALAPTWRNRKTAKNWKESMDQYVLPSIGNKPIDQVGRADVLKILMSIWTAKPNLARKIRQRMSTVFKLAMAYGHIDFNPTGEAVEGALPKHQSGKTHHRALPYSQIPDMLRSVVESDIGVAVKAGMCWIAATACRSGEARFATWDEINLDSRIWKIPSSRMKANKEHRVPLTDAMLSILESIKPLQEGSNYLFPSARCPGNPLGENAFSQIVRQVGFAEMTTVHGLRSSFRDWAAEMGIERELAEQALAHKVQGVEGAYFRSDLFARRRVVMEKWAEHCFDQLPIVIGGCCARSVQV